MVIIYTFTMLCAGFLLSKYLRQHSWKPVGILVVGVVFLAIFVQIGLHYVITHPRYPYGGYYSRY